MNNTIDLQLTDEISYYSSIDCTLANDNLPTFTYMVKSGWSDLKIGQILFANEGLYDPLTQKKND